jgi:hypothetical protein
MPDRDHPMSNRPQPTTTPDSSHQNATVPSGTSHRATTTVSTSGGFLSLPMGRVDFSFVDTTPGAACILAPEVGQDLDTDAYRALIRRQWRLDPGARQHLAVFALGLTGNSHAPPLPIIGPYATEARAILTTLARGKLP